MGKKNQDSTPERVPEGVAMSDEEIRAGLAVGDPDEAPPPPPPPRKRRLPTGAEMVEARKEIKVRFPDLKEREVDALLVTVVNMTEEDALVRARAPIAEANAKGEMVSHSAGALFAVKTSRLKALGGLVEVID